MNILIVEDSATLRHVMCLFIERAGHTTIIAENGEQALQIFDSQPIDMVIMDIEMPGLNGLETTRIMRDWLDQEDLWLPIIFVTGKADEDDLREGIEVGGDDYLIKPVSETIITAKIRAMERIIEMRNELKRLNESLVELSERDSLTHLYNRRTFDERAERLWKQAARESEPIAILLMDIDHFKLFNDFYGHIAGDKCIKSVADTIKQSLSRPGDIVARYGGEEFIAILPNTNEEGAKHVAERLRKNIEQLDINHEPSPSGKRVTLSIGGAVIGNVAGTELQDQIHAADQALYESKIKSRNCSTVKLFNPKIRVLIGDKEGKLRRAVDGKLMSFVGIFHGRDPEQVMSLAIKHRPEAIVLHDNIDAQGAAALTQKLREDPETSLIPLFVVAKDKPTIVEREYVKLEPEACLVEAQVEKQLIEGLDKILFY